MAHTKFTCNIRGTTCEGVCPSTFHHRCIRPMLRRSSPPSDVLLSSCVWSVYSPTLASLVFPRTGPPCAEVLPERRMVADSGRGCWYVGAIPHSRYWYVLAVHTHSNLSEPTCRLWSTCPWHNRIHSPAESCLLPFGAGPRTLPGCDLPVTVARPAGVGWPSEHPHRRCMLEPDQ